MLVHAHGFAVNRGVADHVLVELDVRGGLPSFSVIGLGGGAARDTRERVHAAVLNSGFAFPRKRVTANLAPAAAARCGPAFDLVLACCVLAAQEEVDAARLARMGLFAQLGLGGDLRPCDGVTAAAEMAAQAGLAGLVVARADAPEAREARALPVAGISSLQVVATLLRPQPAPRPSGRGAGTQAARGAARAPGGSVRAPGSSARTAGSPARAPGGSAPRTGGAARAPGSPALAPGSPARATGSPARATGSPARAPGSPARAPGSPAQTPVAAVRPPGGPAHPSGGPAHTPSRPRRPRGARAP